MKKIIFSILAIVNFFFLSAQNLVVNPNAESMPRGTGWTVVNAGASTCLLIPTSSFLNWTIIPDGSANYPFDHTTGAAGGSIFFPGCTSTYFAPAFELLQNIDVSADATNIDLGIMQYDFSGYMQTPVTNQSDQGRFIVDYLNASNSILGTSYTSSWQSNFLTPSIGWVHYTDSRLAPVGTRVVRIRMQAEIFFNVPAVNVYFDDVTFTKPIPLPITLVSFTGNQNGNAINLNWKVADEINLSHYELEQSTNGINFTKIATIAAGKVAYSFIDKNISYYINKYYYRLKIVDNDGKFSYSIIVPIIIKGKQSMAVFPNPAKNYITVTGLNSIGKITIFNTSGISVFVANTSASSITIPLSKIAAGLYIVRFTNGKISTDKKLIIEKQ